jgi:hypothetical protein
LGQQVLTGKIVVAAVGALSVGAATLVAQGQVAPEFRTAPRSLITEKLDRSRMSPTPGTLNPIVAKYWDLGEANGSLPLQHIQLLLQRTPERQAAFDAQVEALHTKSSPSYNKWLTPEQVGSEFGTSASDLATITSYLAAEGLLSITSSRAAYISTSTEPRPRWSTPSRPKSTRFRFPVLRE